MAELSRRSFLTVLGAGGCATVSGCLGDESVSVIAAGSLASVIEEAIAGLFESESGAALHGQYLGSNAALRMVEDGQKAPDAVLSADVSLLRERLYPEHTDWDVVFCANEIGLAYDPETNAGSRLARGDSWLDVLLEAPDDAIAISDPDLDPLGYRAMQLFELAGRRHGRPTFAERMAAKVAIAPAETQLLANVEAGHRSVAIAYWNMASDHGLPFRDLPAAVNFGDPGRAEDYAEVSYTTSAGRTIPGSPILYNATVLDGADSPELGRTFVSTLLDAAETLRERGLTVPAPLPTTHGSPPEAIG